MTIASRTVYRHADGAPEAGRGGQIHGNSDISKEGSTMASAPPTSHQTVRLTSGPHASPQDGVCVMELASMLAGESFSDRPRSVCRVAGALLRGVNDRVDDKSRQRLYRCAAEAVGTAGDPAASDDRLARCARAAREQRALRRRPSWLLRREPQPPSDALSPHVESYVADIVRTFPKTRDGATALLALVDDVLAIRSAPEPRAPAPAATPPNFPQPTT